MIRRKTDKRLEFVICVVKDDLVCCNFDIRGYWSSILMIA